MAAQTKPIPEGYHTLTPYLVVDGAEKVVRFMKEAFGAQAVFDPMMRPDGKIMHAEFKIGDSVVMIADAFERAKATSAMLHVYVPNVDAVYQKAIKAGATSEMEPADMFYGDRSGGVKDPAGNRWHIGTHIEDVSPADLKKRGDGVHEAARQGGVGILSLPALRGEEKSHRHRPLLMRPAARGVLAVAGDHAHALVDPRGDVVGGAAFEEGDAVARQAAKTRRAPPASRADRVARHGA